jgi:type VI secretion system secreted protein Hcp
MGARRAPGNEVTLVAEQDMFLKLEGARLGAIKGESQDDKHKDEIDVLCWSWGMEAHTPMSSAGASQKATINELNVSKRVDSASTALMIALRNNEEIKKAVLTVRKAGKTAHEYLKITIQKGRITAVNVRSGNGDSPAELFEDVSFAFQRITVEYVPQGPDGQPRGAMLFETEIT